MKTVGSSPRHFTADYVERTTLRDGTPIVLRLIVPEDKALLEAGFDRWSPESRYARFLGPKSTLCISSCAERSGPRRSRTCWLISR